MADRYCSNCRAELAESADSCAACGVYAGDLFDERSLKPRTRRGFWTALAAVTVLTAGLAAWLSRQETLPAMPWQKKATPQQVIRSTPPETRVVGDRPGIARRAAGAKINEAEATRFLRRHIVATSNIANPCLVVMSNGPRGSNYYFTAFNRCDSIRLGQWRVDGKSGDVGRAK
jgi:hypothetical protein